MPAPKHQGIRAEEVLDAPPGSWMDRPWSARREAGPDHAPFCDLASSMALASLARLGGDMPASQRFAAGPGGLLAWSAAFPWGTAWVASRGDHFWAWAQGDGTADARVEMAGSQGQWDDDLAEEFARALAGGFVDKL